MYMIDYDCMSLINRTYYVHASLCSSLAPTSTGGTFKQKVVSVTVADDDISVNRAPLAALAVLAMLSQAVVVI